MDCDDGGLMIGFYRADLKSTQERGGAMLAFLCDDLESSLAAVTDAGAKLSKEIFSFPGGRRFQFFEPSGNEFAIWQKTVES